MKRLTPKQKRFVAEYLADLNAAAAARRAGYSPRTAAEIGHENLIKPHVAEAVQKAMEKRAERTQVTQDQVVRELVRIGFADIRNLVTWSEDRVAFIPSAQLTPDQAAAVSSVKAKTTRVTTDDGVEKVRIELELKTYDKQPALEKLGRHLGMWKDAGGDVTVPIYVLGSDREIQPVQVDRRDGKRTPGKGAV